MYKCKSITAQASDVLVTDVDGEVRIPVKAKLTEPYQYVSECSNRGSCDREAGVCRCYTGAWVCVVSSLARAHVQAHGNSLLSYLCAHTHAVVTNVYYSHSPTAPPLLAPPPGYTHDNCDTQTPVC